MCQYNIPLGKKNAIQWHHPLKKWWYSILFSFLEEKKCRRGGCQSGNFYAPREIQRKINTKVLTNGDQGDLKTRPKSCWPNT